jgi:CRISPR-associated protein Cas2
MNFGGLNTMWVIVLFDLPADTKVARRHYTQFRKFLLEDGFKMMQYSVYIRHSSSEENAQVHINRVKNALPPDGEVRIVKLTDKQFGKMKVFFGKKRKTIENTPRQLRFF